MLAVVRFFGESPCLHVQLRIVIVHLERSEGDFSRIPFYVHYLCYNVGMV